MVLSGVFPTLHPFIYIFLIFLCFFLSFFVCLLLSSLFPFSFYKSGKINDFNLEEEAYGWSVSQYPQRKKIQDKLTPFLRLYETANDFLNEYQQWLHGPLSGVNPDKVPELGNSFVIKLDINVKLELSNQQALLYIYYVKPSISVQRIS